MVVPSGTLVKFAVKVAILVVFVQMRVDFLCMLRKLINTVI